MSPEARTAPPDEEPAEVSQQPAHEDVLMIMADLGVRRVVKPVSYDYDVTD